MKNLMRTLVVSICSLALVSVYGAQKDKDKSQQRKQTPSAHHAAQPTGHSTGAAAAGKKTPMTGNQGQNAQRGQTSARGYDAQKGKKNQTAMSAYDRKKRNQAGPSTAVQE